MEIAVYSDDGTHLKGPSFIDLVKHLHKASGLFGKNMNSAATWKQKLETIGFVNVKEDVFKVCETRAKQTRETHAGTATAKSLAEGSQAQRTREIPAAEYAGSIAPIHIRVIHALARLETSGD